MKKIWLLQLPIVILFTACLWVTDLGAQGSLKNHFLHNSVFPKLRTVSGFFTNQKFRLRGPEAPKNKIVIVEIDSPALYEIGRWPWHRDVTARLIDQVFDAGAKVVGLDMVFSEPDRRISPELAQALKARNLGNFTSRFETDPVMADTIRRHADRLVLGWMTDSPCQPQYGSFDDCPVTNPDAIASIPRDFGKFAMDSFVPTGRFYPQSTPLLSAVTVLAPEAIFSRPAKHAGGFYADIDSDGYIRREPIFMFINGKPMPALALEMASVGLGEKLRLKLDHAGHVSSLTLGERPVKVNPMGVMAINFRGPGRTFPYVPALEFLENPSDTIKDPVNHVLTGKSKKALFKDAYVLIGLTANGVYDMRSFPFDTDVAGVEGHATILDNLLSGDALSPSTTGNGGFYVVLLLMTVGALAFGYLMQRLESVQALLLFAAVFLGFGFLDVEALFKHGVNWDTGFLMMELSLIFVATVAAKYIAEEQNKKFIKSAFSKYVAPSVVDSILKDPKKLSLGGERKDLTILFSDIRGFTTFSEQMDAKALSHFLNDYLGIMTRIVFAHDGTLDKYIGDAVMAFWGAPLDQPAHADNATRAATAMMKALAENRERFKSEYGVDVNVGIGINTGVVSVGNMGSESNFEYTVIGDHVNLASRLEGLTKAYGVSIVTTRFTMDHIGAPLPSHRVLDRVKVKGKKTAVELIQLLENPLSDEGARLFEQAKELYVQRQWDAAIARFNEANRILGGSDGPCVVYLERCENFKLTPPPSDWDGSWEMHSK